MNTNENQPTDSSPQSDPSPNQQQPPPTRAESTKSQSSTTNNRSSSQPMANQNSSSSTSSNQQPPRSSPLQKLIELESIVKDQADERISSESSPSRSKSITAIDESLRSFQLLQALRSGDSQSILKLLRHPTPSPGQAIATTAGSRGPKPSKRTSSDPLAKQELPPNSPTPLHLAVQCAKLPAIQLVLSNCPPNYLNTQDRSGQTPLHLACSLGRSDVVTLFLSQPQVDDSIKDRESRTCLQVCKTSEVARLIQNSRAQLSSTFLALLSAYIASPANSVVSNSIVTASLEQSSSDQDLKSLTDINNHEPVVDQLYRFMLRPRCRSIDLNLKEEQSGTTVLHEAARRKDISLIKLAINRGADVLAKDRRNKMPGDVTTDERVKNLFRKAAVSEGRAIKAMSQSGTWTLDGPGSGLSFAPSGSHSSTASSVQQPTLKGYLAKWTNMARGYSTRWLVLEKGYLSYYRDQKDEGKTVRGSIAMSVATVFGPDVTKDKLRFEVSSKLGNNYPRFYLKGAHPLEVMRWVDALKQAIECANHVNNPQQPTLSPKLAPNGRLSVTGSIERDKLGFVNRHLRSTKTFLTSSSSRYNSSLSVDTASMQKLSSREPDSPQGSLIAASSTDDESYQQEGSRQPPSNELELLAQGLKTHIEMTKHLIDSLTISTAQLLNPSNAKSGLSAASSTNSSPSANNLAASSSQSDFSTASFAIGNQRQAEVKQALKRSMEDLSLMIEEYHLKSTEREKYYTRKYEEELLAKKLWEENMQALIASHAEIEQQLHMVSRDSSRRKKQLKTLRAGINESSTAVSNLGSTHLEEVDNEADVGTSRAVARDDKKPLVPKIETITQGSVGLEKTSTLTPRSTLAAKRFEELSCSSDSEDEEDEFFEAIEMGSISVEPMVVTKPISARDKNFPELDIKCLTEGYEDKRTTLPIKSDDRPTVSLWGILKNSIGKDLTKISFPVSFNEPISMLQRMAEDMQFSECLDVASEQSDSLIRLAYVAGFAMSNYSSTVDRLAKPFNPLLGETFEYVEPKKEYRYLSEQISHHPPMSAFYAESPRWRYSGEIDAKNKFTGKSFEIRPTGVPHLILNVPKTFEGVENYPESKTTVDRVEEHYSWKRVTTCVTNFILGSPAIDHYGDMEIVNHRTGERCVLTFKPRGWRGKDANEIKGSVFDRRGNLAWEIAGKWTTQLIARRAGSSTGELAPDQSVPMTNSANNLSSSGTIRSREYLQLWKNDERVPMPFNLTKFAVSLNDINDRLKVWLPPTDCRLRPDQHAFERGAWEKANELKSSLEDYQRMTRRKRELGELPKHEPRWFKLVEDQDTGEKTWDVIRIGDDEEDSRDDQSSRSISKNGNGAEKKDDDDDDEEGGGDKNDEMKGEGGGSLKGKVAYWEERKRVGLLRKSGKVDAEWDRVDHIFGEFELIEG